LRANPRESLVFFHLMSGVPVRRGGLARLAVDALAFADKEFGADDETMSYLREKARGIVTLATEEGLANDAVIMDVLSGSHYSVVDDDLVFEPGVRVRVGHVSPR
jgi:hypothetical protein